MDLKVVEDRFPIAALIRQEPVLPFLIACRLLLNYSVNLGILLVNLDMLVNCKVCIGLEEVVLAGDVS